jgi:hypothetical protein
MTTSKLKQIFAITICNFIFSVNSFSQISKIQEALNLFNSDSLVNYTKVLTGMKGINEKDTIKSRLSGTSGNELAFQYAKQLFKSWNLNIDSQQFSITGKNLLAAKKGYKSNKYILLGGHYDAVGSGNPAFHYPGADDNASGTSGVLEAARVISQFEFPYTIKFALWDEEEQGLLGSRAFGPPDDVRDFVGYINLDMIAWDGNNDSLIEIHTRNISNSNLLSERVMNVLKLYNIGLQYKIVNPGDPATDHKSFWDLNLTAIGINEEYNDDFNPNWHKINDSLSKFNIPYYSKMVQLSIATLMDIALDSNGILSAKEIEYEDPLFIYPNPVEDILFFNLSTSKIKYNSAIITDVTGKKVLNFTDISNLSFLNLSGLNQGTYFLTLISGAQSKKPLKIIKI